MSSDPQLPSNTIPVFPSTNSIPPSYFYNIDGLTSWLNQNPTYKKYFVCYRDLFPTLYSSITVIGYDSTSYNVENVPLESRITSMSQYQLMKYTNQLRLFRQVYAYNSNAYLNALDTDTNPTYFRFQTYNERSEFRAAVQMVNKLYPFNAMLNGTTTAGSTLGWYIPFPLQ